jgi:hypothetical protein
MSMLANHQPAAINRFLSKWWRKTVLDEGREARKARLYQEHIANIKQAVALLEAIRLCEAANRARKNAGASH